MFRSAFLFAILFHSAINCGVTFKASCEVQFKSIIDDTVKVTGDVQAGWVSTYSLTDYDCPNSETSSSCLSENNVLRVAQRLVSSNLTRFGFNLIILGEGWSETHRNNSDQRLLASVQRFPNGMDTLAQRLNDLGIKLGLQLSSGETGCKGFPGSSSSELLASDLRTIGEWGVSLIHFDGCSFSPANYLDGVKRLIEEHQKMIWTRRTLLLSFGYEYPINLKTTLNRFPEEYKRIIRSFGQLDPLISASQIDQLISGNDLTGNIMNASFYNRGTLQMGLSLGNLSENKQKSQFVFWCINSNPLFLAQDLSNLPAYFTNSWVQDICKSSTMKTTFIGKQEGNFYVWKSELTPTESIIAIFSLSREGTATSLRTNLKSLGVSNDFSKQYFTVSDLLESTDFNPMGHEDQFQLSIELDSVTWLHVTA